MARECIENDYGMCRVNGTEILQSHGAQSVRQRSNIEYRGRCENGESCRRHKLENAPFALGVGWEIWSNRWQHRLRRAVDNSRRRGLGGSQLWQIINIRLACGHYNNIRYFIPAPFQQTIPTLELSLSHHYLKWTVAQIWQMISVRKYLSRQ